MKTRIFVPYIECDSCVKVITRKFQSIQGIHKLDINQDSIDFDFNEDAITAEDIITSIQNIGFRASLRPFERKSFKERWNHFNEHPHKYEMPIRAVKYSIYALLILIVFQLIAYVGLQNSLPDLFSRYGWWLLYLDLSVASIGGTVWYMASHKTDVSCMTGMMIGMTVGMQTGMMIGAVVGATNGFFVGAMVGMLTAVVAGTLTGAVCGIMGAVQGMMSGVMAGTMGAMITVMMITDNVLVFMPFYMAINVLILGGLIYLYYEDVVEGKKEPHKIHIDFPTFASACVIVTTALTLIMIYGPKSPLFA